MKLFAFENSILKITERPLKKKTKKKNWLTNEEYK